MSAVAVASGGMAVLAALMVARAAQPAGRRMPYVQPDDRRPHADDPHHALDAAARAVRAGHSAPAAIAQHLPLGRYDDPLIAQACTLAMAGGPDPARVLEHAAATLRERDAVRQEQRVHATQARLSARVMTTVPLAFAALTAWSNDDVKATYRSPFGLAIVATGVVLNLAGWWWMRRIVGRAG